MSLGASGPRYFFLEWANDAFIQFQGVHELGLEIFRRLAPVVGDSTKL
jgi:hypothetical protein